ncbi:MAG: ATP-binding protein [Verrucomicrobiota bacterium]
MFVIRTILLLCVFFNVAFALYIFLWHQRELKHICFGGVVIFWALWNFSCFILANTQSIALLEFAGKGTFVAGLGVATSYLLLTFIFPDETKKPPSPLILCSILGASIGLAVLSLFTPFIQEDVYLTVEDKRPIYGMLFPLYVLYMVVVFIWSNYNLFKSRSLLPNGRARMQINYMVSGFVIAFILVTINHFILAPLFNLQFEFLSILITGILATLAVILANGYAIYRHRLMDIGLAVRHLFIYSIIAVTFIVLLGMGLGLYVWVFRNLSVSDQVIAVVLYGFIITALIIPLHNWVKAFIDRKIFKGRFDPRYVISELGNRLMRCYGWQEIAETLVNQVTRMMQPERVLVYLKDQERGGEEEFYKLAASVQQKSAEVAAPAEIKGDNHIFRVLDAKNNGGNEHHWKTSAVDIFRSDQPTRADFKKLEVTVAFPIRVADKEGDRNALMGAIFLGEPAQENTYTREDLRLLQAMAFEAAVVLDNARLHEDLLASHRHYKAILQYMQRGVLAVDQNLNIITINKAAQTILGADANSDPKQKLEDIVPEFAPLLKNALAGKIGRQGEEINIIRNEQSIPCGCETSLLYGASGTGFGALIVFEDLTDKKRFETEVRRVDRLASVGTLAAGVAHEIKNPLVSIQTFAQLLPQRYNDNDFRNNFGGVVRNEIERINKLIASLLDFARPHQVNSGNVELAELIDRASTLLENQFKKNNVDFQTDVEEMLPPVIGDSEQLFQVIFNLLQNAAQAVDGEGGNITVKINCDLSSARWRSDNKSVYLRIADDGCGIEEKEIQHIFDPFYSTKSDGSGLGLSICHSIIEEHGAKIDVTSKPGEGTEFVIEFRKLGEVEKAVTTDHQQGGE